jgi:hypothetical protein
MEYSLIYHRCHQFEIRVSTIGGDKYKYRVFLIMVFDMALYGEVSWQSADSL